MGFKTLAIEKSASDVWKVLSAAKTEFGKYSTVMDTLARQLETAQKTVSQAGTRTRAVNKALSKVEDLELPSSSADILGISLTSGLEEADEDFIDPLNEDESERS
jgi:DNA recombination protein RmuC